MSLYSELQRESKRLLKIMKEDVTPPPPSSLTAIMQIMQQIDLLVFTLFFMKILPDKL